MSDALMTPQEWSVIRLLAMGQLNKIEQGLFEMLQEHPEMDSDMAAIHDLVCEATDLIRRVDECAKDLVLGYGEPRRLVAQVIDVVRTVNQVERDAFWNEAAE